MEWVRPLPGFLWGGEKVEESLGEHPRGSAQDRGLGLQPQGRGEGPIRKLALSGLA